MSFELGFGGLVGVWRVFWKQSWMSREMLKVAEMEVTRFEGSDLSYRSR